jgi:Flp pilus assembly protein TadG
MALIAPFLLVFVMGTIDFGLALRSYSRISNAAREGARYGVNCEYSDNTSPEGIKQRVVSHSSGLLTISNVEVPLNPTSCATSGTWPGTLPDPKVQVDVTYSYNWITPLGGFLGFVTGGALPDPLPMKTSTAMRLE